MFMVVTLPKSFRNLLLMLLAAISPWQAAYAQTFDEVQFQDARLATIADRLLVANSALCRTTMPVAGLVLHSIDQYSASVPSEHFANGPLAVAALVPGGPAERAGLQPDDGIVTINGVPVDALVPAEGQHLREAAFERLADSTGLIDVSVRRNGATMSVGLQGEEGCRALVEIRVGSGPTAQTDGRVLQVRYDFAAELSDDTLAVVVAHELAHVVLEHRKRKQAAGIDNGLFASLGRNQQANRAAEIEADRLSVHLLANAGYSATLAPNFWRNERDRTGGMPSFVYPTRQARAELLDEEIARYLPTGRGPSWPGHLLALRGRGFE